jgi:hypothetical protein
LVEQQPSIHQASAAGSNIQRATMVEATLPNGTKIILFAISPFVQQLF